MVSSSGQHKCGLIFCGIMMLVLGSGITVTGFLIDFLDPYDRLDTLHTNQEMDSYFTHTQYWLGIPLFLLGVYVVATSCCKVSCLMVFGLIMASLVLVLSIFAMILEGPLWRITLKDATQLSKYDCHDENDFCVCSPGFGPLQIKCEDVKYRSVIYTFTVAFSALASLICVFCAFTYFRILGWMLHISYDDPIDDYYAKAVNSHFVNGHHGRGRSNDVALGTYPQ